MIVKDRGASKRMPPKGHGVICGERGKEKGGAPVDAPPCGLLWREAYFISLLSVVGGGVGAAPSPRDAPAPAAWLSAQSLSVRNVGFV